MTSVGTPNCSMKYDIYVLLSNGMGLKDQIFLGLIQWVFFILSPWHA